MTQAARAVGTGVTGHPGGLVMVRLITSPIDLRSEPVVPTLCCLKTVGALEDREWLVEIGH